MDLKQVKETTLWELYRQSVNYMQLFGTFSDTDRNYRMYNGDQWEGLNVRGIEKVQLNYIRPIVRYKTGVLHQNLFAINYSSENFESRAFRKTAENVCKMLNKYAAKVWEKDKLDAKLRIITKDAAINDEGIIYTTYDADTKLPINEILNKTDIFYGNENSEEIQTQPYIILKKRLPIINAREIARKEGVEENHIELIVGDNDNLEEAGEQAKWEKDNMCTVLTKLYKENGKVFYEQGTRYVKIKIKEETGLHYYPVSHFTWDIKKGSARGEGEVRTYIPNQLEVNKTLMRRALVAKNTAYPQKAVRVDALQNPDAIDTVGGVLKFNGKDVTDITKVFHTTSPAQMSTDVKQLQEDLINVTRELAGAGDIATGQVNPESASGKAILAVQQASQQPLSDQLTRLKDFIEDIARIWLDMLITYNPKGIKLEEDLKDTETGEEYTSITTVQASVLNNLKGTVKVDITPRGPFDKYAQELSIENLLKAGFFNVQKLPELKAYVQVLDDDSTMPKQKLEKLIEYMEEEQKKIAIINANAQMIMQNASQFINSDLDAQASQIIEAGKLPV